METIEASPDCRMSWKDALAGARVALAAQRLTPSEFDLSIADRLSRGEIDEAQALREILAHHDEIDARAAAVVTVS